MRPARRQGRRALGGALLILLLVAVAVAIFLLDDIRQALTGTYTIVGVFPDARALRPGAPVWIAGRPVGEVAAVEPLPPGGDGAGRFAATLRLPAARASLVRRDSELGVAPPRLLADPVVNIMPGTPTAPQLAPGDTLVARPERTLARTIAAADTLRAAFDSLLAAGRELETHARRRAPAAEAAARSLGSAARELDALAATIETGPLAGFTADSTLASLDRAGAALDTAAALFRTRAAELRDPRLAGAFRRLGARAAGVQRSIRELHRLLSEPYGFFGRWERDPALREALRATRAQLDSLIAEARKRPGRFVF